MPKTTTKSKELRLPRNLHIEVKRLGSLAPASQVDFKPPTPTRDRSIVRPAIALPLCGVLEG